jgi:ArsR family transcriptional regulator
MATKIALDISQCAPTPGLEPLARTQAAEIAGLLKAVADPTRLQILALIRQGEDSKACTCDLTGPLNLSQPTISHHMKKLTEVGLLTAERKGTWVYYSINQKMWNQISGLFI